MRFFNNTLMLLVAGSALSGCGSATKRRSTNNTQLVEERLPAAGAKFFPTKGIPAFSALNVNYKHGNTSLLKIKFNEPVVISTADKPYNWGYFQFPEIGRNADGNLIVTWAMNPDAMEAYGLESRYSATSTDGGKAWVVQKHPQTIPGILLPSGDRLTITTPRPVDTNGMKLPKPIGTSSENYRKADFIYYHMRDLPKSVQGVFFKRLKKGETEWKNEQDELIDPSAIRYSLAGKIPVVWWGDMHLAKDGSVIAGIYPGNMVRADGSFDDKNNIFFYRSADNGKSWQVQGRIYYQPDNFNDPLSAKRMGLLEPGFEVLADGTFVCVMRTHDGAGMGPMYVAYSKDEGKTWTKPAVMAGNGVLPRLLQLENGVVVLSSGRPGVQIHFATKNDHTSWSQPFEMVDYDDVNATVSCGYTGLVATGKNSFIIAYSDFNYKTATGGIRKAIKVREITVDPK